MFEIERKFRLNENEAAGIKTRLDDKYGPGKKLIQKDELFLFKKSSYAEHVRGEAITRIRESDGKTYFTYKRTVLRTGNRVEHETEIAEAAPMRAALLEMGWRSAMHIQKTRWHYHSAGVTYDLDDVEGLGHYLEIEIVSDQDSDAESALIAIAEELGILPERIERGSYGKLLWEKNNA